MRSRFLFVAIIAVVVALGIATFMKWQSPDTGRQTPAQSTPATYVGRQACTACHGREDDLWSGSDHDLAMQVANEETVRGDFNNTTFTYLGVTSRFFKRNGTFFVRTDGPDGKLHEYQIEYTFGVTPLQQYLIEFPGGRYQVLGIAWDTRPKSEGGQRWFHLYPSERIRHDDILHWTGLNQNWNYMCAECHSTNLQKNYDLAKDRYETTWSEINVSCEACHGPGSRHVDWAQAASRGDKSQYEGRKGLVVRLKDPNNGTWNFDMDAGTAQRSTPLQSHVQIETCARCHSRRSVVHDDYVYGRPLMDTHRPALLTEALYHADGQILDEVYVYGSFLQSKMFHAGVTCSDCHDPHSLKVDAPGNALCTSCHLPTKYDTPSHHFHKPGSPGASCVECHMPAKAYMVVDPRRDHSMRVPRPDLSVKLGTPNACNKCHTDRSTQWAADAVEKWYGSQRSTDVHFGEALHAGRSGLPGAEDALVKLAGDDTQPNVARASAFSLLRRYPSPASVRAIQRGLEDDDPLVRLSALRGLELLEPKDRLRPAYPLLNDPIRAVRIEAARVMASVPRSMMTREQRDGLNRAIAEYVESQRVNADRPSAHLNLGVLYTQSGKFDKAEAAYRTALRVDPSFVQAYVNLADLYRLQGQDDQGERILREALTIAPRNADVHQALGLLLVRHKRMPEAVKALGQSARLRPDNTHYSYVYAVALHTIGRSQEAIKVLKKAHARHPNDREVLYALVVFNRDMGNLDAAGQYAEKLIVLSPQDPTARRLLNQLKQQ